MFILPWSLVEPKTQNLILGEDRRLETQESCVQVQRQFAIEPGKQSDGEFFHAKERPALYSIKSSTDWVKPTHTAVDNLLYSKSTIFNVS